MKMSMSGMKGLEFEGHVHRCRVESGHLVVELHLDNPLGWQASAAMTREDLGVLLWTILRTPSAWAYLLRGR